MTQIHHVVGFLFVQHLLACLCVTIHLTNGSRILGAISPFHLPGDQITSTTITVEPDFPICDVAIKVNLYHEFGLDTFELSWKTKMLWNNDDGCNYK